MARTVLLTTGNVVTELQLPSSPKNSPGILPPPTTKTIEENERDYILNILNKCNGKLGGLDGAAKMMNINVSTLRSRMKKLGIEKKKY